LAHKARRRWTAHVPGLAIAVVVVAANLIDDGPSAVPDPRRPRAGRYTFRRRNPSTFGQESAFAAALGLAEPPRKTRPAKGCGADADVVGTCGAPMACPAPS
jgi:hypothetical protein